MNQRQERALRRELVKVRQDLRGVQIALDAALSEVVKLRKRAETVDAAAEVIARVQQSVTGPPVEPDQDDDDPDPVRGFRPRQHTRYRYRPSRVVRRPSPGGGTR